MSRAFEPVEDVGAAGVVDLIERVGVRLLHGDSITAENNKKQEFNSQRSSSSHPEK